MSLIITIGCPGAGKSTWADANLGPDTLRLERDRFREAIFGSRRAYHESEMPRKARSMVITKAMLNAMIYWPTYDWALTDTGLDPVAVEPFITTAEDCCVPIKLVIFDRPWRLLLERNQRRIEAHRIPDDILNDRFGAFIAPDAWWRTAPYERIIV
jgi:predicted kinase